MTSDAAVLEAEVVLVLVAVVVRMVVALEDDH